MVFAIISGILSLLLLLLLKYGPAAARFTPLILTVEIGLVAVIITSIMRIISMESKNKKLAQNNLENLLAVNTCPDYWTFSETNDGGKSCLRTYKAPGGATTIKMAGNQDSIDLSVYNKKTLASVCRSAANLGSPWTDVRAVCDAFNVSLDPST